MPTTPALSMGIAAHSSTHSAGTNNKSQSMADRVVPEHGETRILTPISYYANNSTAHPEKEENKDDRGPTSFPVFLFFLCLFSSFPS